MSANKLQTATPTNRMKRALHRGRLLAGKWFAPRREKQPVFILAAPRTGSTLIEDYLNSVPGISMAGEILSPTLACGLAPRPEAKRRALEHIAMSLNSQPTAIAGAKFLLSHLPLHGLTLDDLRGAFPSARYLVMYRASLVEQCVSFQVAKISGKWVGRRGTERYQGAIRLAPEDFLSYCRHQQEEYDQILNHSWLPDCGRIVCYEELASNPQLVFDKVVFPLLGLPVTPIVTQMEKQINRKPSEIIENYDEISELLAAHGTHRPSFGVASADTGRELAKSYSA